MAQMAKLALFLFGAPRIERDGTPVAVDTRKAVALLGYLAVTRQPQRRDRLADLLWPEYDQPHARATLRRTLSTLNAALAGDWLEVNRETIGLSEGAPIWSDVAAFHERLSPCPEHKDQPERVCPACMPRLVEAVALYTDHFMAGFTLRDSPDFDDWQFFQREGLQRDLASALERLAKAFAAEGNFDAAIGAARRWLTLDRLHEPAYCALMSLYARAGQRAAALRQYRECVHVLDRELGVAPLESTTRLYESIKEQQIPRPSGASTPDTAAASPSSSTEASDSVPAPDPSPAVGVARTHDILPLRGRKAEWSALEQAYAAVRSDGRVAILDGEAGIGKTRLAADFVALARQRGATVIEARCYEGEARLAFGAVGATLRGALAQADIAARLSSIPAVWLAEAARLAPELAQRGVKLPPPTPLNSPGAQAYFFEGVRRTLFDLLGGHGARPSGILFIDDMHWADNASIELLTYLARRMRDYPILLLLCWRHDEAMQNRRLRLLLADSQRSDSATMIALSRLGPRDIRELVHASQPAGGAPSEELARRLHEETEGLPLFVVEYLTAMAQGVLSTNDREWALPGGVRHLLQSRLNGVGETAWQILTAAAAIGRSFEFETVREASGRSEDETVAALEELIAHGLVKEVAGRPEALTYDFSHDKVRTLVYDDTSLARKRLLHRRIAEALVARTRNTREPGQFAGQIADHFAAAGRDAEAADYYKLAGERARTLYAHAEALAHLKLALALGHPQGAVLYEAIGDLHTLLGEYKAALTSYEAAAALAGDDPNHCARLDCKLGNVYARRGEWELAESHVDGALTSWGDEGPVADRARAYSDLSLIARNRGQLDRAKKLAEQALALANLAGDTRALAQAHNVLGMLANGQRQFDTALEHLERSLALAEQLHDATVRIAALNNLALVQAARGDTLAARALVETALRLSATQSDRHREAALHNNLADLLRASGDIEAAMAHLKTAVVIFAEIGAEAGTPQPEIWKLTEW